MMLSKLKNLLKQSLIYSLSGIAVTFIGIFLVPVYTRIFSPGEYGVIDLIATVTAFLNLFLILGIDCGVARYFVDTKDDKDKKLTASTGLFFTTIFSFLIIFILLIFSKELSGILFNGKEYSLILLIALIAIPFSVLFYYFLNMLKWRFQAKLYAIVSASALLIQIFLTIYLVVFRKSGLIGIYIASLTTHFIFSIIGFYLTRSNYSLIFSFNRLKQLLYFGIPYVLLALSYYIMTYSDRYFLKYFRGLDEVGLYGVGYKLASVISLAVIGFQHAWGPFVLSTYKDEDAKRTFSKVYNYSSIIICTIILFISLYSREILKIFTTEKYLEAYKVVPFIMVSMAAYTFGGYFSIGIGISKKTFHKAWGGIVAALVNLGLNFLLIPHFGMIGAAIATIISFLILGVILMTISQKYYYIQYKFKSNLIMYFIAGLIIFITYKFLPPELTFLNVSRKFCLLMGFIVIPFLLKLIGEREIGYIKKILVRK